MHDSYSSSFPFYTERWIAGQKVGGNAEDSRNCREGAGKSEARVDEKLCRDRKVTAADADESGGAEYQRETNKRTSGVSVKN